MAKKVTEDGEVLDEITEEVIGMAPPFFKTPHNHDTNKDALTSALYCKDKSKTQQHHAAEADINNILAKFIQTGELATTGNANYGDATKEFDLQNSIVTADQVEQAWNALTPQQRNTLRDPKTFVEYVEHCLETGDLEPLRELGLAKAVEPPPTPPKPPTPSGGTPAPDPADKGPPGPKT